MQKRNTITFTLAVVALLASAPSARAEGKLVYNRDVRPILSDNCFACHGNDKNKIKGKLKLNDRASAVAKGAIVPGKPDESELVSRILSKDPDEIMPPPEAHKTLSPAQIETLKRWVAEGAEYQPHWAYITPARPAVPQVKDEGKWARTPIDRFVLAELERRNLKPSAEADRTTLVRRVTLDLTGLPPTPAEVDAFVADKSPEAYEKLVDRLLASPRYGERMAVPWLDAVRFSDTVGFHGDQNQRVFPFRDYVINAFNANKPFDKFTIEQLAGDLLPNPTTEQMVASGFNRLNMMTREGGAQPKEYVAKYQADRVRTVTMAWMGSTFGCAECHDHKFDPISAKDFYAMGAFFADVRQWGVYSDYGYTPNPDLKGWSNDHPFPPEILVDSPYLKAREARLERELDDELGKAIEKTFTDPAARAAFDAWYGSTRAFLTANPSGWETPPATVASGVTAAPARGKAATKPAAAKPATPKPAAKPSTAPAAAPAGTTTADGFLTIKPPEKGKTNDVTLRPAAGWVAAIRLEASGDPAVSTLNNGSQRQGIRLSAAVKPAKGAPRRAGVYHADADHKEPRYSSTEELIGVQDGWKLSARHMKQTQTSVWLLDPPLKLAAGDELVVSLSGDTTVPVRLSVSPLNGWDPMNVAHAEVLAAFAADPATRARPQSAMVLSGYLVGTAAEAGAFARFKVLQRQILECRGGKAWTQVTVAQKPIVSRVLPRGNWLDETGEVVQPQTPHFLPKLSAVDDRPLNRLDLANWLVSADNPLTSRVIVNRFWKQFLGTGLCASVEDFGLQGEWPSHPDLLDWLAVEFRQPSEAGAAPWDMKRIVRLIVTSSTYRQASKMPPALRETDPQNRLLAAQSPRRLEAEFVRDNALFAAGLLNVADVGGPSVKPYQPDGYYAPIQFPDRPYRAETDDRQYRRGVYVHWQRTFLHPMLANFDAPSREDAICRTQSNTPQQALTLLNDPTFVEASRVMAEKVLAEGGTDEQRIEALYRRAVARQPKPTEVASLKRFLAAQREIYKASPDEAKKLLTVGVWPQNEAIAPAELGAWANTCRVVLNLHETITRY